MLAGLRGPVPTFAFRALALSFSCSFWGSRLPLDAWRCFIKEGQRSSDKTCGEEEWKWRRLHSKKNLPPRRPAQTRGTCSRRSFAPCHCPCT